jgi:signal transduction histidine kinase
MKDDVTGAILMSGSVQDVTDRRAAERERVLNLELLQQADAQRQKLLQHLVDAQEEERERIAGDIHDDPIQKMTAVGMRIETARRKVTELDQIRLLGELSEVVQGSIASLRNLMFDLRPRALDQDGLGAAIRVYLRQLEEGGIRTYLDDRLTRELTPGTRTIAYRIAQEAIINVRKHANAKTVEVELSSVDQGVLVRIMDDGVGFDAATAGANGSGERDVHFGIGSMRQRAEMAGGWWRANSTPGEGSVVEVWLPLGPEESKGRSDPGSPSRRRPDSRSPAGAR